MGWKSLIILSSLLLLSACERPAGEDSPSPDAPGVESQSAQESASLPETIQEWIQERAQALQSVEDLSPVIETAGQRDLILLGEASHGTREFYTWRADLSLAIAKDQGLDFIAIEADWHSVRPLYDFVLGQGDADALDALLLQSFDRWPQWMWANHEFRDFLLQLREFNQENPQRPIHLYGIDVQSPYPSLSALQALARAHRPEHSRALAEELQCLGQYAPEIQNYGRALHDRRHQHHGHGHDHGHDHSHDDHALGRDGEEDCQPSMERMLSITAEIFDDNSPESINARKQARVVAAAEAQQRSHFSNERGLFWNTRARAMYEITAGLLRSHGDNARGLVWAHNTHIGDARATYMIDQNQVNLGQLSREELGADRVLAIGFSTFAGEVLAGQRWGQPVESLTIPDAMPESLDELLHRFGPPQHFLTFQEQDRELPFFQERIGHRAIGVVYQPRNERFANYVATEPAARYDVLIFLDRTTALTPLQ